MCCNIPPREYLKPHYTIDLCGPTRKRLASFSSVNDYDAIWRVINTAMQRTLCHHGNMHRIWRGLCPLWVCWLSGGRNVMDVYRMYMYIPLLTHRLDNSPVNSYFICALIDARAETSILGCDLQSPSIHCWRKKMMVTLHVLYDPTNLKNMVKLITSLLQNNGWYNYNTRKHINTVCILYVAFIYGVFNFQ